jgi:hypothetical protein
MDIPTLSKDLLIFLTPFLPYLLKMGDKAAEEASKKFGAEVWERAKNLWGKLHPKIETKPAAQEAVQDVAATPDDVDAQAALCQQLKKLLTEDQSLAEDIAQLWAETKAAGLTVTASGERSIAIGRDVSDSTIITGDQNRIS